MDDTGRSTRTSMDEDDRSLGGGGGGGGGDRQGRAPGEVSSAAGTSADKRAAHRPRNIGRGHNEAAKDAGVGRLFLEVRALSRNDYFGDTVLVKKTKQPATIITTSSTRCFVLNKWDFLRRVDKDIVERVFRDTAKLRGVGPAGYCSPPHQHAL